MKASISDFILINQRDECVVIKGEMALHQTGTPERVCLRHLVAAPSGAMRGNGQGGEVTLLRLAPCWGSRNEKAQS